MRLLKVVGLPATIAVVAFLVSACSTGLGTDASGTTGYRGLKNVPPTGVSSDTMIIQMSDAQVKKMMTPDEAVHAIHRVLKGTPVTDPKESW